MSLILEGKKVSKHFGGLAAVDRIDFHVEQGEIRGFIGPNGSGKTTLINLISGVFPLTEGEIWFKGQKISDLGAHLIGCLGIARTYQIVKPFSGMTVQENILVGALHGKGGQKRSIGQAMAKAEECMEFTGLTYKKDMLVSEITIPDCKRLELARTLAMDPDLLLLDEVMTGLNPKEVEEVMEVIRRVNARGVSILVIEHVMKAIMGISHRIFVMHHGQKIAEGTPQEIAGDERVIQAYLGERYARKKMGGPA